MKQNWHQTAFGKIPFKKVKLISFSYDNSKAHNRDEIAWIQYKLLLNDNILQLHIDPFKKTGKAVIVQHFKIYPLLKKEGLKTTLISDHTMLYADLLESNNLF
ncbi:MAG: hypothetical protein WC308_03215 [archaeon]|jgi:hypothetical protein